MNIYQEDFNQTPELFRWIKAGNNAAAIDHLRRHPEEVQLQGWMNDTPLHIAAAADNLEMVQFLVQNGADVNASRTSTYTLPLHWAKSLAVATYLLDHGATLDARALEYATRSDVPEIIMLLLDRGAVWPPRSPPYLFCRSIAAIRAYVAHGTALNGHDDHGRNLLHHLVWNDLPDVFDFAYAHGAPWKQDLCGWDPYYFGKSGGRKKTMAHIEHRYPEHIARTVRPIKTTEIHFNHVLFLKPCTIGGNAVIVWTRGEKLGRIEIHAGRWTVTHAIHVNVNRVWSFCINDDGNIILPTADNAVLVLDAKTLQLKRTLPLPTDVDFENICYLPSRQKYLAYGGSNRLYVLNLDFALVQCHPLGDRPSEVQLNPTATLLSTVHYDHEFFRVIYHLDENFALLQLVDLEDCGHGSSKRVMLENHGAIVNFAQTLVAYRYQNKSLDESWQLPLGSYPCAHDLSCTVFVSPNEIIVGRGKHLLLINAQLPKIMGVVALDLVAEIQNLYLDATGEYLIVRAGGLKLLQRSAIHWEEPP